MESRKHTKELHEDSGAFPLEETKRVPHPLKHPAPKMEMGRSYQP